MPDRWHRHRACFHESIRNSTKPHDSEKLAYESDPPFPQGCAKRHGRIPDAAISGGDDAPWLRGTIDISAAGDIAGQAESASDLLLCAQRGEHFGVAALGKRQELRAVPYPLCAGKAPAGFLRDQRAGASECDGRALRGRHLADGREPAFNSGKRLHKFHFRRSDHRGRHRAPHPFPLHRDR